MYVSYSFLLYRDKCVTPRQQKICDQSKEMATLNHYFSLKIKFLQNFKQCDHLLVQLNLKNLETSHTRFFLRKNYSYRLRGSPSNLEDADFNLKDDQSDFKSLQPLRPVSNLKWKLYSWTKNVHEVPYLVHRWIPDGNRRSGRWRVDLHTPIKIPEKWIIELTYRWQGTLLLNYFARCATHFASSRYPPGNLDIPLGNSNACLAYTTTSLASRWSSQCSLLHR